MFAQETAFVAAITFLPRHGASTLFPMGSQINPSTFCKANEAAERDCAKLPLAIPTNAAAAIPEPEPHSAIHPPTSAANVACAAIKTPISPAASIALTISSSDSSNEVAIPMIAPGKAPQDPAVGAATITPMELFTSMMAETYMMMMLFTSPPIKRLFVSCSFS